MTQKAKPQGQRAEPQIQKADPEATEDYSQTLKPNTPCHAGFKNCLEMENDFFSFHFLPL